MGVSAKDMLRAIADGEDDPVKLSNLARRTMKRKKDELVLALKGYVNSHQRLMLKTILTHIDFLTDQIELLDNEIAERVSFYEEDIERLDSIPGIAKRMTEQILAEIGPYVGTQFPSAAHLCYWAALVPGHNESAGKRKSARAKKGNKYLRSALTEAAQSFRGSKNTWVTSTDGKPVEKVRNVQPLWSPTRCSNRVLPSYQKEMYVDLGEDYFDKQRQASIVRHSVRRLENLGFTVTISEAS
ncbi:transposase [Peribacillus deserti]|uniref:transposase n=1 Tax=Peribacillus deserti TaxID=673318 RepID=UPI00215216C7|nr:transposase [Peribacillus deserti]